MSKILNSGLDQYGAQPFKQQQFRTAGVEEVNTGLLTLLFLFYVAEVIGTRDWKFLLPRLLMMLCLSCVQTLLTAIEEIISSHRPLKRNEDSQFKAFVCLGLKSVSVLYNVFFNNSNSSNSNNNSSSNDTACSEWWAFLRSCDKCGFECGKPQQMDKISQR